jgi:hypothetical protein
VRTGQKETCKEEISLAYLEKFGTRRDELQSTEPEALRLETSNDLANQPTLHTVGLDHDVRLLGTGGYLNRCCVVDDSLQARTCHATTLVLTTLALRLLVVFRREVSCLSNVTVE